MTTERASEVAFRKVKEPYGWMGNMAPYPITVNGQTWRTSEALFQALRFDDESIREAIRAERSPMSAKFVAKARVGQMSVIRTGGEDVANMKRILRLKLDQHPNLKTALLETADARIVENSTSRAKLDNRPEIKTRLQELATQEDVENYVREINDSNLFWGAALVDGQWLGRNRLGELWMEVRAELAAEPS
jgi:predicted NAD-dependent protein-ADP-ribosyltransferase YbiA (DUF1768 family)